MASQWHRAFLNAQSAQGCNTKRVTRFAADPKWRPASLVYEEEATYDDEEVDDDENFDEITLDNIDSLTSLDDDDDEDVDDVGLPKPSKTQQIKADIDPKFKRTGYFERQDLNRLDVSEFDRQGDLQRLSIEDLEHRIEQRFGVSDKATPLTRDPIPSNQDAKGGTADASEIDDFDLFWKPGRRKLRSARPSRPLRSPRPLKNAPMALVQEQNVKGRPKSPDLRTETSTSA